MLSDDIFSYGRCNWNKIPYLDSRLSQANLHCHLFPGKQGGKGVINRRLIRFFLFQVSDSFILFFKTAIEPLHDGNEGSSHHLLLGQMSIYTFSFQTVIDVLSISSKLMWLILCFAYNHQQQQRWDLKQKSIKNLIEISCWGLSMKRPSPLLPVYGYPKKLGSVSHAPRRMAGRQAGSTIGSHCRGFVNCIITDCQARFSHTKRLWGKFTEKGISTTSIPKPCCMGLTSGGVNFTKSMGWVILFCQVSRCDHSLSTCR